MFVASKITYLENPARRTISLIESKSLQISDDATIHQLLECFPDLVLILNEKREIVAYNSKAEEFFQLKEKLAVIGERLGDALGCIHAKESENGCGSTLFCSECKANNSCKKTIDSLVVVEDECRINITYDGFEASLDLKLLLRP